jgi:hypothetical protein
MVPQGVDRPIPMPNVMGRRPIADGVRATRSTRDGHREHATPPTKKNTHPTHLRASSLFVVFSFFLGLRRERRRAAVHSARDPQKHTRQQECAYRRSVWYILRSRRRVLRIAAPMSAHHHRHAHLEEKAASMDIAAHDRDTCGLCSLILL